MSISYAPGTAYALVRPGVVVLLDGSVAAASVSSVWASLERLGRPETSMADVLDAVTTVLDPSLRELPDFAIVLHEVSAAGEETGVLHVVARGTVSVHLAGEVGSETIEAFDMTTWADKRFTDVDHYEVASGPTGLPAEISLALGTGVATARSVSWQRPEETGAGEGTGAETVAVAGTAEQTEAPGPGAEGTDGGAPAAVDLEPASASPTVEPDPAMVPVHPAEPDFARTLGEFPDGALEETGLDEDDHDHDHDPHAEDVVVTGADPVEAPAAAGVAEDPISGEQVPDDVTVDGSADVEDDTVLSIDGLRSHLQGSHEEGRDGSAAATEEPSDEAADADEQPQPGAEAPAPVSPAVEQPVRPALPPVPPPPPAPPVDQPVAAVQPVAPTPPAPAAVGDSPYPVYQAAPQTPPGEAFAPVPTQDGSPTSGQQWTVQLPGTPVAPAPVVGPPPVPAADVPTILARSCAYGHANTPVRSTCAVCGGGLNPQAEVVPRPSLGRVVLSTGDVVELEQPVVFGRYPQAHVVTAQAQAPLLVTVPSPSQDISRSHLEVRLEGWNVLLVDLTTVNGTTLLRPGQPPRRLHPQEPTLVVSGDVADLGDGVRLTFEGVA